jgi:hypothetical protein
LNKRFSWYDFRAKKYLRNEGFKKISQLGERIYEDYPCFSELTSIEKAFMEIFYSYEMGYVSARLVDEEVILISIDQPKGSLLPFPLPMMDLSYLQVILSRYDNLCFSKSYHVS